MSGGGETFSISITGDSNDSNLVLASSSGSIVENGPQGPQGPPGPAGPAGLLNDASYAEIVNNINSNLNRLDVHEGLVTQNIADINNLKSGISVSQSAVVTISNDLVVNGKITENAGNDPDFVDYWSGMWGNLGYVYRSAALILQPDQTYDYWFGGDNTYQRPLTRVQRGIKPGLGGKQIVVNNPFLGPQMYVLKSYYTNNSADNKEAYNVYNPGWTGTAFKIATPGNSGSFSDPVLWIEEFNRMANENVTKRLYNLDSLFDLKNTWNELQHHLNQSNSSKRTLEMQCSNRLIASNIHQKSGVEMAVHHDKLGNSTITYDYPLLSVVTADLSGSNNLGKLLVTKYDFRKANEQNKIMLFDHVKISGTGTELDNVPHFKVSKYMHGGYSNSILGAQLDEMNFKVALRSPIKLDNDSNLSATYKNKTFNAVIKAGYYYPTELALEVTQKLQLKGCNLKVILLNDVDFSGNNRYFNQDQSCYAVVSETSDSVSFSGDLSGIMDLGSLTVDASGSPLLNSGKKFYIHKGGKNITKFTPMNFDLSSVSADALISVTHGNATITDSPRNYYATVVDMIFESFFEEHANFRFKVSFDVDLEYYVPETWELYEMYIDDVHNFNKLILSETGNTTIEHRQLLNTPSPEYSVGIAGPPGKSITKLELNASKRFDAPYSKLLGEDVAQKLYDNGGFSHKNYLENTYQIIKEEIYSLASDGTSPNVLLTQRVVKDDIFDSLEGLSYEKLGDVVLDPSQIPQPPDETPGVYKLHLFDSWGDGWNGAVFKITNSDTNEVIVEKTFNSGSLAVFDISSELFVDGQSYDFYAGGGSYDSEIGWKLVDPSGWLALNSGSESGEGAGTIANQVAPFVGESFYFSDLSTNDLVYHKYTLLKANRFGILKDSVVQKLLPDVSNAKVGYLYTIDCNFTGPYPFNQDGLTELVHKLFTDNSVNIVVNDVRGNSGGEIGNRRYCPFGPKQVWEPWQYVYKLEENVSANRNEVAYEEREVLREILSVDASGVYDNSGNFPSTWFNYYSTLAQSYKNTSFNEKLHGGFDNTAFYEGVSGEPLKFSYLTSLTSISSPRLLQMRLNTMSDSSGNIYDICGNLSAQMVMVGVTGSTFSTAGSYPSAKHNSQTDEYRKNAILNYQVADVRDRNQPVSFLVDDVETDDLIGECYNQDAITDHDFELFKVEIGLKNVTEITGVDHNDPATWRDLLLEKAVKCAAKGKIELAQTPNGEYGKLLTDVVQTMF